MERFSTLVLMLAGVAIGGYELMPAPPEDTTTFVLATHVSAVPKTTTSDDRALRDNVRAEEPVRTFSPTSPAFREHNRLEQANAAVLAAGSNTGAWTTVVTAEQPRTTALKPPKPNDWQTRYELARDLQRELKRVGCYGGEISGVWTRGSKAAMSNFMDRVNASLPVDQPDYVLLSLVQGHRQIACGVECPSGQVIAEGGRCVPRAVVAQATKKSQRLQERRLAEARLATGKIPRIASEAATNLPPAKVQALASAEPEKLPWLDGNGRSITKPSQGLPESSFPGRMSMGGPVGGELDSGKFASRGSDRRPISGEDQVAKDKAETAQASGTSLMIALTHNDNATSGLSTDAKSEGDTANLPSEDVLDEQPSEGGSKTTNSATRERGFGSSARSRHHSRTTSESRYSYGRYSNPRRTRYVPLQRLSRMIGE